MRYWTPVVIAQILIVPKPLPTDSTRDHIILDTSLNP